jgi:hypothetical protein
MNDEYIKLITTRLNKLKVRKGIYDSMGARVPDDVLLEIEELIKILNIHNSQN